MSGHMHGHGHGVCMEIYVWYVWKCVSACAISAYAHVSGLSAQRLYLHYLPHIAEMWAKRNVYVCGHDIHSAAPRSRQWCMPKVCTCK